MAAGGQPSEPCDLTPDRVTLIRSHLERVLASKAFTGSKRCQDFLRLVVELAVAGRLDDLRERMIGAEMFGRPVDYDTANDAVVRVKAIEVRRRLARYYAEEAPERDVVRIGLPTGSYVPEFRWESAVEPAPPEPATEAEILAATPKLKQSSYPRWMWLALAALVPITLYLLFKAENPPAVTMPGSLNRLTWDSGFTTDGDISPDGRFVAYASDRANADNLDIYVQEIKGGNVARFTEDPADDYDPVFSPDGAQIAFRSERNGGGIYQVSALGGAARLVVPHGRGPRFSPDGRYLLYWQAPAGTANKRGDGSTAGAGLGAALFTQEVAGGSPVQVSRSCTIANSAAVWSPDSRWILFAGVCEDRPGTWLASPDGKIVKPSALYEFLYKFWKDQELKAQDLSTAAVFDAWLDQPSRLLAPLIAGEDVSFEAILPIAPDGSKSAGPVQPLVFGPARITHSSASRNGRIVLSSAEESSNIWKLSVDSSGRAVGKPVPVTTGSSVNISPALSRDGTTLVFASRQSGVWELQLMNMATGALTHLAARLPYLAAPVFNGTGERIDYIGQSPDSQTNSDYELAVKGGVPVTIFEKSQGGIWDSSPDGAWLLVHGLQPRSAPRNNYAEGPPERATISLADRSTLQTRPFLSDPGGDLYQAHFSPNGRWVVINAVQNQHSRIYVVPFSTHLVPKQDWIPITDGTTWDDKPRFYTDGKLIFFTSDRDGFRCIWAQRLTADMHPSGSSFAVYHFHSSRRSVGNAAIGRMSLAVGPETLVFNQVEYAGNLWLLDRR